MHCSLCLLYFCLYIKYLSFWCGFKLCWQITLLTKFNNLTSIIITDIWRLLFYGVSVTDKSLLSFINASDDFSHYAAFLLLFLYCFSKQRMQLQFNQLFNCPTAQSCLHQFSRSLGLNSTRMHTRHSCLDLPFLLRGLFLMQTVIWWSSTGSVSRKGRNSMPLRYSLRTTICHD
jgi:hypothetical protein